MMTLLLLTFLRANGVKSDQFFKDCIGNQSSPAYKSDSDYLSTNNSYELLLKYPFENEVNITRGDFLDVCCNNTWGCHPVSEEKECNDPWPRYHYSFFSCSKFNSGIFCYGSCLGMVGNNSVTSNATKGTGCSENKVDLEQVAKNISSLPFYKFDDLKNKRKNYITLNWHDDYYDENYYDEKFVFPHEHPIFSNYLISNCRGVIYWENSSWTCSCYIDMDDSYCYLQWSDPFPGKKPMTMNPSSLPTPWPISLINAILAFFGVITASDRVNCLSQFSAMFTTTRCSIALIGSWVALGVFGLSGFQYPELAWLASLATVIYFTTFQENIIPILTRMWRTPCRDFFPICCIYLAISLPFFFNVISPPISYLWNIVSLGVHSGLYNFQKSAQFNTSCLYKPETSWHTIVQCVPESTGFSCLLGSRDIRIMDLFIRSSGALLPLTYFWAVPKLENKLNARGQNNNGNAQGAANVNRPNRIKAIKIWAGIIIGVVTGFYLIAMASIQAIGLNTTELKKADCDINQEMISSKTGYLKEWLNQEITPLKQFSLT